MIAPVIETTANISRQESSAKTSSFPIEARGLLQTLARHPLRVTSRTAWLGGELLWAGLGYPLNVILFRRGKSRHSARAFWFQRTCRRISRVFNIDLRTSGTIPTQGLLVSNHLSYLDILALGSLTPVVFVSKHEVKSWPVFGWFARMAGTVFVQREKRNDVRRSGSEIGRALNDGALVVLFPEGTSSGGETVLPFKSALLAPATQRTHPLSASLIRYALNDGNVSEEVCYWGDMTLVPHLINLLGKQGVSVNITFAQPEEISLDRKELARQLHSFLLQMKEARVP